MVRAVLVGIPSDFVVDGADLVSLRSRSPSTKHSKSLLGPRNAELSPFGKIGQGPCSHTKGMFDCPAPLLVAVAWSFYKYVPNRASSNLHNVITLRIASRVNSPYFCLRIDACEHQASNCELQFGVGVV